jgi:dTDP-4-amino-4,6-dideoxygalactose transaminase
VENPRIPFNKPFVVGKELFNIAQAVMNGSISGDGEFTKHCQIWLEQHLGTPKALLTHSCTAALEMAAILSEIGPGDEVIMPSFTFVSTANAFVLRGATPVFVDIRRDTLNIDEQLVASAITSKTKAIVAVHYAGQPCAMDSLLDTARARNLLLIEDAAQAILSEEKGNSLGTIGDLGCLSFHETKNVISGEGGALLINNPRLIERAEIIWQKGTNRHSFLRGETSKYTWVDIGSSFLPSELTAAFLYAQLEHARRINSHRRTLYLKYLELLAPLAAEGWIKLPAIKEEMPANAHLFYVLCKNSAERSELITHLDKNGITAVFHYIPLHDSPAGIRYARTHNSLPVTSEISSTLLRLPMFTDMTTAEVRRVCSAISTFYNMQLRSRSNIT